MDNSRGPVYRPATDWRHALAHAAIVLCGFTALHLTIVSPILWDGRLVIERGDSAGYQYPAIYAPFALWENNLYGGFPRLADPQMLNWYPPAVVLRFTGAEWLWSVFVLMAGVLASCFTYGLAYRLTGSPLAAAIAGVVYGCGSFLTLHIMHVGVTHGAAWIPLMLWSLEELRHRFSRGWIVVLALAVAHLILAGHPQEAVYGLALAGLYFAVQLPGAPAGRRAFGGAALGLGLGVGLTALQILPTAEFVPLTARDNFDFGAFTSFALPLKQLPMLVFPFAYGSGQGAWLPQGLEPEASRVPYFGKWLVHEISGFCGLGSLVLAVAGFLANLRTRQAWFWVAAALIALVFALGEETPASRLLFHLPVFNKFRCPGRFFMIFELAVALLAAAAVQALPQLPRPAGAWRLGIGTVIVGLAVVAAWGAIAGQIAGDTFCKFPLPHVMAESVLSSKPWLNPEIGRPLLLFVIGLLAVWAWFLRPGLVTAGLAVLALTADVTQMGTCNLVGKMGSIPNDAVLGRVPPPLESISAELASKGERMLARDQMLVFPPGLGAADSVFGNIAMLWGLPNAEGYSPLEILRQRELLAFGLRKKTTAEFLAIRYLVQSDCLRENHFEVEWARKSLVPPRTLGAAPEEPRLQFTLPPTSATRLALITGLGNGTALSDGTAVAEITVHTTAGDLPRLVLRAGDHVAEMFYDRPDVRAVVAHGKPAHALEIAVPESSNPLKHFFAELPFGQPGSSAPSDVSRLVTGVEFRWVGPSSATLTVCRTTLVDDLTGQCQPLLDLMGHPEVWQVAPAAAGSRLFVARNALPLQRAWLVGKVSTLAGNLVRDTVIFQAPLPDGTVFHPYETALVEQAVPIDMAAWDPDSHAAVWEREPCRVVVKAHAPGGGFLVLGDVNYPGWEATVDGQPTQVFQTDYVLRGVVVPAGDHLVEFSFHPTKFYQGLVVSGLSAAVLLGCAVGVPRWARRSTVPKRD
jgi:hypothetical protein